VWIGVAPAERSFNVWFVVLTQVTEEIIPVVIPKRLAGKIDIVKQRPALDVSSFPIRFAGPEGVGNVVVR
jgi:hypothetical protein